MLRWLGRLLLGIILLFAAFWLAALVRERDTSVPQTTTSFYTSLGNVTAQLSGPTAGTPVMIVPGTAGWSGFWRDVAAHLAGRTGAALRFVAVAEIPEQRSAARAAVQRGLAYAPVEIDALADVVDGSVGRTLADLPGRTDLLVVGARGYRFMPRLLPGGVVGVLVRTAYYPVVVVPG